MKISTKGRYGARASLELALRYGSGPVMVRAIAASQNISERYLENILNGLRAAGLVTSTRGAKGGYELSRSPETITLGEILRILEGPMDVVPCTGNYKCPIISECVMCRIWSDVKGAIEEVVDNITLKEMVDSHMKFISKGPAEPEYII